MAADDETVERHALSANFGAHRRAAEAGRRAAAHGGARRAAATTTRDVYWERDESHDLVVSLNHGQPALEALCRVLEGWVRHFLGAEVRIAVERAIDDDQWVWHVGPGRAGQRGPRTICTRAAT